MVRCGVWGGRFLILHVEDRGMCAVERLANGVVTVLVMINGNTLLSNGNESLLSETLKF